MIFTNNRRILFLEYVTIAWNVVEGVVSIAVGIATNSIALTSFGIESAIEVFSSGVVVWQLKGSNKRSDTLALKMLGIALLLFSFYVFFTVAQSLLEGVRATPSFLSLVSMFCISSGMLLLGLLKRSLGRKMENKVVLLEANITLLDAAVSGSLFFALLMNAAFGWWWLDPLFATLIGCQALYQAVRELKK